MNTQSSSDAARHLAPRPGPAQSAVRSDTHAPMAREQHALTPEGEGTAALVERLDRLLPQTQCGQCGYDGCRPYAEAMAAGDAGIDHCPPGGDAGARALAHLLGVPALPYDRSRGEHKPAQVAVIVEADCIGCTKCIQACPVDAIVGGAKYMHTVLADLCTGCELCIPPCPVDCIELQVVATAGFVGAA